MTHESRTVIRSSAIIFIRLQSCILRCAYAALAAGSEARRGAGGATAATFAQHKTSCMAGSTPPMRVYDLVQALFLDSSPVLRSTSIRVTVFGIYRCTQLFTIFSIYQKYH